MPNFKNNDREAFETAFATFFEGVKQRTANFLNKTAYNNNDGWRVDWMTKRVRIVRDGGAHCFVDYMTGDVLKPASWAAPAKHARGNIFDEDNGLKLMGPFGPAYLR